ncbi:alpha/beta fold hydrolase [Streptomyces sp. NPDC059215]|uniref:alpha/beta fold hydrolase n=1 Tax=unclassified Streptomyces TaxID=2593676 RepID=UPI0036D19C9C
MGVKAPNAPNHRSPRETPAQTGRAAPRTLVVDGVRQVYRVTGAGPVCLVHSGGPGVHPEYLRMPDLESRMTMVHIDPVGSGDSDLLPDGDYSMSRYAGFAAAVLDDLGAPTAYFLGHSHGGFVGLQFALDHPERLDGLVLYDTAPLNGRELRETATQEMAAFARRRADRPEAAEARRVWDEVNVTRTRKVTDHDSYAAYLRAIQPAYFADHRETAGRTGGSPRLRGTHDPNRLPADWDVRDRLGAIGTPALVIVGAHDFICPPKWARQMYDALPDARLCELSGSGHFGHIEEPALFATAVLDFVHGQEAVRGRAARDAAPVDAHHPGTRPATSPDLPTHPRREGHAMTSEISPEILEKTEAEEMYEYEAGVAEPARSTWGLAATRLGGGVVLAMRDDPSNYWNKALGFGFDEPVTLDLMEQVIAFYRERDVPRATIQLAPSVIPEDWPFICEKLGIEGSHSIRKLAVDVESALVAAARAELDEGLTVGPVDRSEAAEWAAVLPPAMGMPAQGTQEMAAASVGRPGWHTFAVREAGTVVAMATLRVAGEVGSLFAGCTMPAARGRGAQSALIAARVRAAKDAGCRTLVVETFDEPPGTHNSSYQNLLRAGFTLQYSRRNWDWTNRS